MSVPIITLVSRIDVLMRPFTKTWSSWLTVFPPGDFQVSLWISFCRKLFQLQLSHSYHRGHITFPIIIHDSDTKFPQYLLSVNVVTPVSVQVSHHQNHIMTTAACNRVLQLIVKFILFLVHRIVCWCICFYYR